MRSKSSLHLIQLVAGTAASLGSAAEAPPAASLRAPAADLNPRLEAPIRTWDEGIPLGNGLLGGLLWGEGDLLRLSLDRGDLWDERPAEGMDWQAFTYANLIRLVQAKQAAEVNAIFDRNYGDAHPTKLPAGRLEITLPADTHLRAFELDLASAAGYAWLSATQRVSAFFSAAAPVALIHLPGPAPVSLRLLAPAAVSTLGYPEAQAGADGALSWFVQEASGGLSYCVCVGQARVGEASVLALTVTSSREGADPLALAQQRVRAALAAGWDACRAPHAAWWERFWAQSTVSVPEPEIQGHYDLVRYFHGAASRRGAPPIPLQGVWTADSGGLPPWKGDYHNDLNTQMTYIAYQTAGHFEEGAAFLDLLWDLLPRFRQFAREFYGTGGAAVPGVMTLAGQPLGGWPHYSLSPAQGAWLGHLFYLHWRYTMDDAFRRERAYPWCREVGECLRDLLKPDPVTGNLVLPLSSSPEIFDNSQRAWVKPNSNYDIMCLRVFFLALAEMASAGDDAPAAAAWSDLASRLGPYHVDADAVLKINADESLPGSHRHLSNLIGIYPFNLLTVDGSDAERASIRASTGQWDRLGTSAWCGYSFSWMSCLRARVGDAEAAVRNLDLFVKAFVLRNGFHANGDQTGTGLSTFTYRPFTLEGNFLAMQAVHEMLLQSWSPTPGQRDTEVIRIFPATPWRWHDAHFDDLRAEGGWRVSARRENNATTWLRVTASRDARLRLRDTFGGRTPAWNRPDVTKVGTDYEVALRAGQSLEATLARPDAAPAAPADLAAPVVIKRPTITANTLPLRIGADSQGGNRFSGEVARATLFRRALSTDEIARLASRATGSADVAAIPGCVSTWSFADRAGAAFPGRGGDALAAQVVGNVEVADAADGPLPRVLRLTGDGFLEIAHAPALDCLDGVTLEAWIRPAALAASGARILDKTPVGAATAYLLDTCPGNSLRLIFRDPHLSYDARLEPGRWVHVAGRVDGANGHCALFIDGRLVAEQ